MHMTAQSTNITAFTTFAVTFVFIAGCQQVQTSHDAAPTLTQVTDWPGTENAPSFAPDKQQVAFDATVDGNTDIYIMALATGDVTRLTDNPSADRRPTWSPSGDQVAYISNFNEQPGIWVMDADGENKSMLYGLEPGAQVSGRPLWASDGARIAINLINAEGEGNVTWGRSIVATINVDTGAVDYITTKGDEWWPAWEPKSEWLYYYVGVSDDIEAAHSSTGDIRPVSKGAYVGWRPVPSPDGKSILFISFIERSSVFIAPIDGSHPPVRLTHGGADDVPSFSSDGETIIFSSDRSQPQIFEHDLTTNRRKSLAIHGRNPQEISDGHIAFLTPGSATWDVSLLTLSSDVPATLNINITPVVDFAYSPEGDKIAIVASDGLKNRFRIEILDQDGVSTNVSLSENGKPETPVWCDDNQTLLYSARETWGDGFREIWAYNSQDKSVSRITTSDINKRPTHCAANAQKITYFLTLGASGIRTIEKQNDQWSEVFSLPGGAGRWSPDGSSLAYTARRNGQTDIFVRNAAGQERQVTNDTLVESVPSWSRDGNRLLFSAVNPNRNIWMMDLPELPWLE